MTADSQELIIQIAGRQDILPINKLAHEIWPDTYKDILSPAQLDYMLELFYSVQALDNNFDQQQIFLIARMGSRPVGFACYSTIDEPGVFKVHKLYVLQSIQGKGLGKRMLDFIVEQVRATGATALQLNVNRYNKARSFYEKYGFAVIREENIPIGGNYYMNDYVMEKQLQRSHPSFE